METSTPRYCCKIASGKDRQNQSTIFFLWGGGGCLRFSFPRYAFVGFQHKKPPSSSTPPVPLASHDISWAIGNTTTTSTTQRRKRRPVEAHSGGNEGGVELSGVPHHGHSGAERINHRVGPEAKKAVVRAKG